MKIAGFEFAEGAHFQAGAPRDAQIVGEHLEMLRAKCKGELRPEDIVDDARNDNSPLHCFFEWSDTAAAHQHRLHQARGLIRAVVAIYMSDDKPAARQRAYVHIRQGGERHYIEASHAMSQPKTRQIVIQSALRELQAWGKRYADLIEFAELIHMVDNFQNPPPTGPKR